MPCKIPHQLSFPSLKNRRQEIFETVYFGFIHIKKQERSELVLRSRERRLFVESWMKKKLLKIKEVIESVDFKEIVDF